MISFLRSTDTFRKILLLLAVMVMADGISTFIALSVGLREGNPLISSTHGPSISLILRALIILFVLYRSRKWARPNRIMIANISYISSVILTGLVVVHNFRLIYYVVNGQVFY